MNCKASPNMGQGETGSVTPWFANHVYSRYWQHYQQAMAWHQRHRRAYQKALEAAYGPGYYHNQYASTRNRYADWDDSEREDAEMGGPAAADRDDQDGEDMDEDSSSDSEIECDVNNMEITEELRQFFAQTARHKEELKRQQEMEAEQQDSYIPADQDMHRVSWQSTGAPPLERPGERRRAEMKKLYGEDAAKIQGMETAMQLTFDRKCDRLQPKYWPVIPLKL
ncbi:gem-associated protein 8 [Lampris incognitus]|uniref:gem-associated protein 8 n=1 Tax=Lampris incognitus TaxID=2546036 RepID=UPI0024B4A797|nr:gem-associated protein 8 [Lampris incognitus]